MPSAGSPGRPASAADTRKHDVWPGQAGLSPLGAVIGAVQREHVCEVIEGAGPNGMPGRPGAGRKG